MQETLDQVALDNLLDTAQSAAAKMRKLSASQVDRIVRAVTEAALKKTEFYAEWAVRETGYGRVESKIAKNIGNAEPFLSYEAGAYVNPVVDDAKRIVSFPKPAGVIVALVPVTNPVCTVYFKALSALITRNAIVLSPHPGARDCCVHALDYLHDVAVAAGAPRGAIQIIREPTVPLVQAMMADDRNNLTLATGGPAMVRAAYSSSNPAIGVGPGNVACYVDRTADVVKAAERIVSSKSFDNSLACTTESVLLADLAISSDLQANMKKVGAYFVSDEGERRKLRDFMFQDGKSNPAVIGKDATWIAGEAGLQVPSDTLILVFPIKTIGRQEPFSKEKLCPVLGYFEVNGSDEGIRAAQSMLSIMGAGHSAVLHANDPELAARYGAALPVCRISVNTPSVLGSSGIGTNLPQSSVIGTGFFGRSSVDQNVGPDLLVQWTRVAYNNSPDEVFGDMQSAAAKVQRELDRESEMAIANVCDRSVQSSPLAGGVSRDELKELLRELLVDELKDILHKQA